MSAPGNSLSSSHVYWKGVAEKRLAELKDENVNFNPILTGYNKYGVVAFGLNKGNLFGRDIYKIYYCSHQDLKLQSLWAREASNYGSEGLEKETIKDEKKDLRFTISLYRGTGRMMINEEFIVQIPY